MSDLTQILLQMESDDPHAAEQLLSLVYEERRKFHDEVCGQNVELRDCAGKPLQTHGEAGDFMSHRHEDTMDVPHAMKQPGSYIGPDELRERLGERGMGVVWAAEQSKPICRKVALTMIKPGMGSDTVMRSMPSVVLPFRFSGSDHTSWKLAGYFLAAR
jgi:hypothetical protein